MPKEQPADLKDLLHGGLARDEVQPPVRPRVQVLPFNQLSWENFERLCTRLVASDGEVKDCHRYGVRGDFQAGIDILAHRRTAKGTLERWCYQCKRWQKMTPGDLRRIVDKFSFPADRYVVLISLEATAALRDVVADLPDVDLWDAEDISSRLKSKPELVEDFFSPAWRAAFCATRKGKRRPPRTPNPFTDVVAIREPTRFVGREALLERLLRLLEGGSVALVGERKIGKSSLLHRLADLLRQEPGQAVVFWDFFDPVDVTRLWARATRELDSDGETWEDFKRAVRSRRVVLLLDEFDVAPERGFDLDLLRGCRALCQAERGLRLVTASRMLPKEIFPKPGAGSWPYDFLGIQPLGPLTEGESHRLLAHPWAPDTLHFGTPVCEELIALSGRHPYRLQRAAHHRYETECDSAYDWRAGYELDLEALP
jgi:energy-coupling factor transporter ATP-binding protein EcfA2